MTPITIVGTIMLIAKDRLTCRNDFAAAERYLAAWH